MVFLQYNCSMKKITVVILAAGMGTRLGDMTKNKPKPMQVVDGATIIQYELAWAKQALKADKTIVVGGYLIDLLREEVKHHDPDAIVVENPNYQTTQRMSSLLAAEENIEGDLVMFDGDYIYSTPVAEALRNHTYDELAVHSSVKRSPYTEQDVICTIDKNRHLTDIYKTPGTVPLEGPHQEWFNSLLYCPEAKLEQFLAVGKETLTNSTDGLVHVEDAVLNYTKQYPVDLVDLGEPIWMEIDNPEEFKNAQAFIEKYENLVPR